MIRISCVAQTYAWGKLGRESLVAKLKSSSEPHAFAIDEKESYSELWMGTHPSGPATIDGSGPGIEKIPLLQWIRDNKGCVGQVPEGYEDNDLPFMFKVLSINTALSIQAHPDKKLAQELHAKFPLIYKDGNHKPEMAIALTPFMGMNGFRPLSDIDLHMTLFPELAAMVGSEVCSLISNSAVVQKEGRSNSETAKKALEGLMYACCNAEDAHINPLLEQLVLRLDNPDTKAAVADDDNTKFLHEVILHLNKDYPGDRGIIFPLILNTITMTPGQSLYMAANEPHAYISGDILECMALSDNVVRMGLTPKFKDKEVLLSMLHYHSAEASFCEPLTLDSNTIVYRPPTVGFSEFEIERTTVSANTTYTLIRQNCASILLLLTGSGGDYCVDSGEQMPIGNSGTSYFLSSGSSLSIMAAQEDLVLYRAHINLGSTN